MRLPYVPEEDAIIRALFPINATHEVAALIDRTPSSVSQRAERLGVKKSPEYLATQACRFNGNEPGSVASRFRRGQQPWNKGTHFVAGGRSAETRFKKGHKAGRAAQLEQPIGALRVTKDGQLQRKVNNDLPLQRRWVAVSRLVWEAAHGPIPAGHAVAFRSGRATTVEAEITLDRLELVSRAELMRRNSYHTRYPKEVAQLIQLRGALNRKINRREREASR